VTRQLHTATDGPDASPGLLLWQVTQAWHAAQRAALEPYGLTHTQFVLLASLTWLKGEDPITQRELARWAGTDVMMTSQVLRTLERKGLVERRPHPSDSRAKSLAPTTEGLRLANRTVVVVEAVDRDYFGHLSDAHAFLRSLRELRATTQRSTDAVGSTT
jgi:MarR family transcriptional regulator, organic hydroperoxide resistance regulator